MITGRGATTALASFTVGVALLAPALAGAAAERGVTVVDNAYEPVRVTVTAGDTVVWSWDNSNENPHTVTAVDGSFDSDADCPPDDPSACRVAGHTFSVEFTEPGSYAYHCRVHPVTMIGTVEVVAASEEPSGDGSTPTSSSSGAPSEGSSPSASPSSSGSPDEAEGASSAPTRRNAGPPGFTVGSVPSPSPSGGFDEPVVAPPPSVSPSPSAAGPIAAPSRSPDAIGLGERPDGSLRRAAIGTAAAFVLLSAAALGRVVLFGRDWKGS